jgi:hypothetical protein
MWWSLSMKCPSEETGDDLPVDAVLAICRVHRLGLIRRRESFREHQNWTPPSKPWGKKTLVNLLSRKTDANTAVILWMHQPTRRRRWHWLKLSDVFKLFLPISGEVGVRCGNHLIFRIWRHNVEPNLYDRFSGNLYRNYRVLWARFRSFFQSPVSVSSSDFEILINYIATANW